MEDSFNIDMSYKLECRICLQVPRPDELDNFGLCMEGGHVTCGPCYSNFKDEMGNDTFCFECRNAPKRRRPDFIYVKEVFLEMANEHFYNCGNCHEKVQGHALLEHEANCSVGKAQCPVCSKFVTGWDLFALNHPCMPTRLCYSKEKQKWSKIFYMDDLFNKDSAIYLIHGEFEFKLCLSHKFDSTGLKMNVSWIEYQNNPFPETFRIRIGLGFYTKAGILYRESEGAIHKFNKEKFDQGEEPEPQLFVSMSTFSKWDQYSKTYTCTKCSKKKSHVHFTMNFV